MTDLNQAWSIVGILSACGLGLVFIGFIYATAYAQGRMHADCAEYGARRTLRWIRQRCERWLADGRYDQSPEHFIKKLKRTAETGLQREEEAA